MMLTGVHAESDWFVEDEAEKCGCAVAQEKPRPGKHRDHSGATSDYTCFPQLFRCHSVGCKKQSSDKQ